MTLRDAYPRPKLPTSHYFFSLAHGERLRTYAIRPAVLWTAIALVPLLALWGAGAGLFIAFHDDMLPGLVAREAQMQYSYADKLARAHAEIDRITSRQLLDQTAFEGKVRELLSRQAQLERSAAIVASMAKEEDSPEANVASIGRPHERIGAAPAAPMSALSAIEAVRAPTDGDTEGDAAMDSVRAFAPVDAHPALPDAAPKPRPIDDSRAAPEHTSEVAPTVADHADQTLAEAAGDPSVPAPMRLGLISRSLDQLQSRQMATLARIGAAAGKAVSRLRDAIADAGVAPDALIAAHAANGAPDGRLVAMRADAAAPAFDREASSVERTLVEENRLHRVVPFLPLRRPLIGLASVSSPFGYRRDPFLGRPMLHPGIDLVQGYGSAVESTGAGRVTHAGPLGGYGEMVEIDHGDGLVTRYGHLSQVLVEPGQMVKANQTVGRIGSTGRSTGPHLHYEVRVDGAPVDPTRFLRAGRLLLAAE